MSFPPATEMVQFAGFAAHGYLFTTGYHPKVVGCPIRRSRDQRALAPPPSFSQRATSFIASRYQGIHQMPFSHSPTSSPQRAKSAQMADVGCPMSDGVPARTNRSRPSASCHHTIRIRPSIGAKTCASAAAPATSPRQHQRRFPGARPCGRHPLPFCRSRQRPAVTHTHARTRRPDPRRLDSPRDSKAFVSVSRSRLASRCQQDQMSEDRCQMPDEAKPGRAVAACASDLGHAAKSFDAIQTNRRMAEINRGAGSQAHPLGGGLVGGGLVGLGRFERPTSRLSGVRSNQLSYRPRRSPRVRSERAHLGIC